MDRLPQAVDPGPAIARSPKILCIACLALAALGGTARSAGAGAPPVEKAPRPDLLRAGLSQSGQSLVFSVRTATTVPLAQLDRLPDAEGASGRYLCLALGLPGGKGERRLCLGGGEPLRRVGLETVDAAGRTTRRRDGGGAGTAAERRQAGRLAAPRRGRADAAPLPLAGAGGPGRLPGRRRGLLPGKPAGHRRLRLPPAPGAGGRLHRRHGRARHQRPARAQGRRPHLRRRPERIHARLPQGPARQARPRAPSSRSARRCRAAKRRCARSSPKATRSATTR